LQDIATYSLLFQSQLLLDAFNGALLEIFAVHGQVGGSSIQNYLEMRAFAGFKRRSLSRQPTLELAAFRVSTISILDYIVDAGDLARVAE
jgi:hypothetical protein